MKKAIIITLFILLGCNPYHVPVEIQGVFDQVNNEMETLNGLV